MSFTASRQVSDNQLALFLKLVAMNGVYSQLSENAAIWEKVTKKKKGAAEGREREYLLRTAFGAGAFQFLGLVGDVQYPDAHKSTQIRATANYKDFALTIEVERAVAARAMSDMSRYGEPLAEEMKAKTVAAARVLSGAAYQDGTGVIGTISSVTASGGRLVIVLKTGNDDRGHIGWFEYGDKIKFHAAAGGAAHAATVSSGTISYYLVDDRDRDTDTVYVKAYDSSGTELTISAVNTVAVSDVIYRQGITANDLSAISTNDYGTISEAFVGLEALLQDDGRKVNGVTLSGATKGSRKDCGGNPIDSQHFQQMLSKMKAAVGEKGGNWNSALMAHEILDALVESRETDRRFMSVQDGKKGVTSLGYQHGKTAIVFEADEFCPKKRIYVLPEDDTLQFFGSPLEWVKPEGSGKQFYLKPAAGGHYRTVRGYMEGNGLLLCMQPSKCGVLENFTA